MRIVEALRKNQIFRWRAFQGFHFTWNKYNILIIAVYYLQNAIQGWNTELIPHRSLNESALCWTPKDLEVTSIWRSAQGSSKSRAPFSERSSPYLFSLSQSPKKNFWERANSSSVPLNFAATWHSVLLWNIGGAFSLFECAVKCKVPPVRNSH